MNKLKTRRHFIRDLTKAGVGIGVLGSSIGCSTFDDYLFDDKNDLDDEFVIIGGGISGLYAAQLLRSKSVEFRLYEAGPYFGGRIKSVGYRDYGANLLSQNDELITKLIDDYKIEKSFIDRDNYFLESGMQSVIENMKERVLGLLPYRNFRMRWKLVEVQKLTNDYELTFQKPDGQKKVRCKKMLITIPPSLWSGIKGLTELPEVKSFYERYSNLQVESAIRLILPVSSLANTSKSYQTFELNEFKVRQLIKKHRHPTPVEMDVIFKSNVNVSIDFIYQELKRKLQVNYPFAKLPAEQFFFWGKGSLTSGAFFYLNENIEVPGSDSILFAGDAIGALPHGRIETALKSVKDALKTVI